MAQIVRIHGHGGPEVLSVENGDVARPKSGEVKLKQHAIGINYIDVYGRTGLYPLPELPAVLGMEGAGEVTEIGDGVNDLQLGDRVAYAGPIGAYASERTIPADRVIKLPDSITYDTAAAMMLQGMTVRYLLRRTYRVGPETTLLFHAAAGGVGLIACQWASSLGATVIATAGTDEKCALAAEHGASHTINYSREDFVERVAKITSGAKCDVVYDSVGKDTFPASLDCLKKFGLFVSFGNASGPVEGFDLGLLGRKGALFATRTSLFPHIETRSELEETAKDLFDVVTKGDVRINVNHTYRLSDVASAHRDLEARATTGSIILQP